MRPRGWAPEFVEGTKDRQARPPRLEPVEGTAIVIRSSLSFPDESNSGEMPERRAGFFVEVSGVKARHTPGACLAIDVDTSIGGCRVAHVLQRLTRLGGSRVGWCPTTDRSSSAGRSVRTWPGSPAPRSAAPRASGLFPTSSLTAWLSRVRSATSRLSSVFSCSSVRSRRASLTSRPAHLAVHQVERRLADAVTPAEVRAFRHRLGLLQDPDPMICSSVNRFPLHRGASPRPP